jgi:hypothetical protein
VIVVDPHKTSWTAAAVDASLQPRSLIARELGMR